MAKNYAEMDTEELKALAEEQKQRQAALSQLARSDPSAMKAMTASERVDFMNQRNQERTDAWHAANAAARERRLSSVEQIAARDRGRYSATQVKAAVDWLNQSERNRRFDEEQKTTRTESENRKLGMIGQGKEAAEAHANAQLEAAKLEHGWDQENYVDGKWVTTHHQGSRERIAEQEAAAKKYLAEQGAAAQKYGIDAEHGKIGEDGKVTPGSRERTAQIQGESEIQKQEAANKGLLAQAEITRQNKEKELATQIEKAQIAAGGKADSAKIASHAKIISAALQGGALQNKDAGTVLAELAEQYKNDPEMLSSIKSAGSGQQQQPQIPGYSPEKVAELQKRGYKWDGKQWVKPE